MNLYVSRNGQTFGPYTVEQTKAFLDSNQLLSTDYALIEGTTEWKSLPEVLSSSSAPSEPAEKTVVSSSTDNVAHSKIEKTSNISAAPILDPVARVRLSGL